VGRHARTYQLTTELLSRHGAGQALCIDERSEGRSFRLHASRPGSELHYPLGGTSGAVATEEAGSVIRVDIRGVLEQRAGYHDYCGGWTDGHDAIAERMCEALELGDVIMVVDSPGGAAAGLEEAVKRVQAKKAEHDRRVYAYADELIGSAAYWWAAAVADEIYVPNSGVVGSIGARSLHVSVAENLKREGIETTYFVWPGDGKVAFAPERPLSETGRSRGERDVALAGEAFASAVEAGRGLSRADIVSLDADCLAGSAAVGAGLADSTASFDDVINHALAIASGQESTMVKTEDEKPDAMDPEEPEAMDPDEPEAEAMDEPEHDEMDEPEPEDEDDDEDVDAIDDEDEDEEDEDDDETPKAKKRARASARRSSKSLSLAELVGLSPGASALAIKNAVRRQRTTLNAVMRELEVDSLDALEGAAKAVAQDARRLSKVEAQNKQLERKRRAARRLQLAKNLAAANLPGLSRGELFIDKVDNGKVKTKLAPEFAQMKLATFESFVARKLKSGGSAARRTTPFDPDQKAARSATATPNLEAAKHVPAVIATAKRTGKPLDECAAIYAQQFPDRLRAGDPAI
jgi:ClpP class serine protease/flavin-binding protein dodecin